MAKKYNRELILNGNMLTAILSLAIPVVINSFLQTMYNLTDTYWLGHIGKEELAAINLVTPVQNIVINFGTGITVPYLWHSILEPRRIKKQGKWRARYIHVQ